MLIWALKKTAAQGRTYFGQVSAGTMLAFVGGCLIFATSWMLATQLYPDYFAEVNAAGASTTARRAWTMRPSRPSWPSRRRCRRRACRR